MQQVADAVRGSFLLTSVHVNELLQAHHGFIFQLVAQTPLCMKSQQAKTISTL